MGTFLFAHLGVPFLVGLALVFFVAAAEKEPISWASCNDIAVDFGILSMGANGGIFLNPVLTQHWGANTGSRKQSAEILRRQAFALRRPALPQDDGVGRVAWVGGRMTASTAADRSVRPTFFG
jgi:hypothetical protein